MTSVEPGKWYLSFTCPNCHRSFAYQEVSAPQPGQQVAIPTQPIPCPFCGQETAYTLDQARLQQGEYRQ